MSRLSIPLSLVVAHRYLRSPRRDAFVSFLSLVAAGGIALGVAALILSTAALSGFQSVLLEEVRARTPHIEITPRAALDLSELSRIVAETTGVRSVDNWIRGRGWVLAGGRSRPVEIIGFQGELPLLFPDAAGRRAGLYLSRRLARSWRLMEGDIVEVVSARPTLSPFGPQPRIRRAPLQGTFAAARSDQAERVAVPIAMAGQLFGSDATRVVVACDRLDDASRVGADLAGALGDRATVVTWKDSNRALFFLLRLEKTLMFVAVFLIVVVAAMAVISDLMLILAQKQSEIGMLGAMGGTRKLLRSIFLWLGGLLVGVGCCIGGLLGIGGAWALDRYRVLTLPGGVYFIDHVPFLVRGQDVAIILATTLLLTMGCAWIGAARAAKLRPVEALRR